MLALVVMVTGGFVYNVQAQAPAAEETPAATPATPKKKLWSNTQKKPADTAAPATAPAAKGEAAADTKLWTGKPKAPAAPVVLFQDSFDKTVSRDWSLMRMQFAADKARLSVLSAPRDGFNYGQNFDGRRAAAFTHIGDKSWTDYRVEMDVYGGRAGEFNPHATHGCMRGGFSIYFRTTDYRENWKQPARSGYSISLNPMPLLCEGQVMADSSLYRTNDWYLAPKDAACPAFMPEVIAATKGLSKPVIDNAKVLWDELAQKGYVDQVGKVLPAALNIRKPEDMRLSAAFSKSADTAIIQRILQAHYCAKLGGIQELKKINGVYWRIDQPNRVVIEVRGSSIAASINGITALKFNDPSPDALLYGGVGVEWAWENTGWIDNVVVTKL